jgi:ADP-ribose pyrophosphatase YjhB (NUDIX family)
METRTRVGAIIIKDHKLLLVKTRRFEVFWTPGGRLEEKESEEECLAREIKEEIRAKMVSARFFKEYIGKSPFFDQMTRDRIYLVEIKGDVKPSQEIVEVIWLSREDFENKKYSIIYLTEEQTIPDLIKQGIF